MRSVGTDASAPGTGSGSALTLAALVERSGSTEDRVRRLGELGIIPDRGAGGFEPGDVNRVRLADALETSGVPIEAIGRAVAGGALSFDFVDGALPEAPELVPTTIREQAGRLGLAVETLVALFRAWGLPQPDPDDPVRADDARMFDEIAKFVPMGAIDEVTMRRGATVSGESARRLATWGMGFFAEFIDEPIRKAGGGPQQVLDAATVFTQLSRGSLETQFLWLLRRAIEHHTMQYVVTLMEESIHQAGIAVPRAAHPPAIAFLDLSGYTSMTELLGDDAAADRSLLLARVVQQPVGEHGGDVIKLLGDGVLMHFPDPVRAVRCALILVERVPAAGLPAARVGIASGPVVWRDGDTFGRTVNLASRILGVAQAGQVLVTEEVVDAASRTEPDRREPGLRFTDTGAHRLKGVADPVHLYRVAESGTARDGAPAVTTAT